MAKDNNNVAKNGWTEYGKLVLKELERLNEGQENIRKDMDDKFKDMAESLSNVKAVEVEVKTLAEWREKVTEVWSSTQMKESKDEVYKQKSKWQLIAGIALAIQVIWGLVSLFGDKLFN